MDDGSDRVAKSKIGIETRSIASFAFVVSLVLLGAGCGSSKTGPQAAVGSQQPQAKQEPKIVVEVPSSEAETVYSIKQYKSSYREQPADCYEGRIIDALTQDFRFEDADAKLLPKLSSKFREAVKDQQVEEFCYSPKENAVYFSVATSVSAPALKLPENSERGNGHVFGFWKPSGFGAKGDRVVFSEGFNANGVGDASMVYGMSLVRTSTGYRILGQTGGGDGPCGWSARVADEVATGKLRLADSSRYCYYSGFDQDAIEKIKTNPAVASFTKRGWELTDDSGMAKHVGGKEYEYAVLLAEDVDADRAAQDSPQEHNRRMAEAYGKPGFVPDALNYQNFFRIAFIQKDTGAAIISPILALPGMGGEGRASLSNMRFVSADSRYGFALQGSVGGGADVAGWKGHVRFDPAANSLELVDRCEFDGTKDGCVGMDF